MGWALAKWAGWVRDIARGVVGYGGDYFVEKRVIRERGVSWALNPEGTNNQQAYMAQKCDKEKLSNQR